MENSTLSSLNEDKYFNIKSNENLVFEPEQNIDSESDNNSFINLFPYLKIFPFFDYIKEDPYPLGKKEEILDKKTFFIQNGPRNEEISPLFESKLEISKKYIKRKRGKKKTKFFKNKKTHKNDASDNLLRKIKVHFLSFIIDYLNFILEYFQYKERLYQLDYSEKRKTNKKIVEEIKEMEIEKLINGTISRKYKTLNYKTNQEILENINKNEVLKGVLSENGLEFFKNIYFKSQKTINLKKYGLDKKIELSSKVKMFQDLLLNNEINDKSYRKKLDECIKKNFIPNLIFTTNN